MNKILTDYLKSQSTYEAYSKKIADLIFTILSDNPIQFHAINSRTKTLSSLEKKIARFDKSYNLLEDITDLSGVRIVTYFEIDIEKVKEIIYTEFLVDEAKSIDKRAIVPERTFGYQSLHLIVSLKSPRSELTDYKKFSGLFCEIQIRTILQHAWAEIEHDIGYKNKFNLPQNLNRRFGKLSALLEIADDEFSRLRFEIEKYTNESAELIKDKNIDEVLINEIVLKSFIENDEDMKFLIDAMTEKIGKPPLNSSDEFWLTSIPYALEKLEVKSLGSLKEVIKKYKKEILQCFFIVHSFPLVSDQWTSDMILFVLILIYPVILFSEQEAMEFFQTINLIPDDEFYAEIKEKINE